MQRTPFSSARWAATMKAVRWAPRPFSLTTIAALRRLRRCTICARIRAASLHLRLRWCSPVPAAATTIATAALCTACPALRRPPAKRARVRQPARHAATRQSPWWTRGYARAARERSAELPQGCLMCNRVECIPISFCGFYIYTGSIFILQSSATAHREWIFIAELSVFFCILCLSGICPDCGSWSVSESVAGFILGTTWLAFLLDNPRFHNITMRDFVALTCVCTVIFVNS